jgi:hypothetical protein
MKSITVRSMQFLGCILLGICTVMLIPGATASANEQRASVATPATVVTLPPGFWGDGLLPIPELWSPGSPVQCAAVYVPALSRPLDYSIQGGGNPVVNEMSYFFYFPAKNDVYSFIDPRPAHIYGKGVLDADYGIAINFSYPGGFPTSFAGMQDINMLHGKVTYPVPGDKWSRVVVTPWPFIKRDANTYNLEQHCRLNGNCYCLKKP